MQTQHYPLIFIAQDNSSYSELIENHLRANKAQSVECFRSVEECLLNLYRKPDIVIQDYLNEFYCNDIVKESIKNNLNTEFVFISCLDNFAKGNNQDLRLISLSGTDEFDATTDTIKIDLHEYVVKDMTALDKLIDEISDAHQTEA